jgi:phosphopentomutase
VRALVLVLDSVGIGHAPDAANYGDEGTNTLGHIFEKVPDLSLPNLSALGLPELVPIAQAQRPYRASFGKMQERSAGKDTTTGHWEIAGVIVDVPFAVFERFPDELVRAIEREAGVRFIGNYACSGTTILQELGAEHVRTGNPILYASADSVLQIAAHENVLPLRRLYEICEIARQHADRYRIGRVIARPFDGAPGSFRRTARRHDYSLKTAAHNFECDCRCKLTGHRCRKDQRCFCGGRNYRIASHFFKRRRHGQDRQSLGENESRFDLR